MIPSPQCLQFEGITTILLVPAYAGTMFDACLPFGPCTISKTTA